MRTKGCSRRIAFFPRLTKLFVQGALWYPSMFDMPSLVDFTILECEIYTIETQIQLHLPKLKNLLIQKTVFIKRDVGKNPYLSCLDLFDMPRLEELTLGNCGWLHSIVDKELPRLTKLVVEGFGIAEVRNFKAPLLTHVKWSAYLDPLRWINVEMPLLKYLSIDCSIDILDMKCPNLKQAVIECTEKSTSEFFDDGDVDESSLGRSLEASGVNDLVIVGHHMNSIKGLTFTNLEQLQLFNEFDETILKSNKFPNLKGLFIEENKSIKKFPQLITPFLESIEAFKCPNFTTVDNLPQHYPLLKDLSIEECAIPEIVNLHYPSLKSLVVEEQTTAKFK